MAKVGALLAVALLAAVGVSVVAIAQRESDTKFVTGQKASAPVLAGKVEAAVVSAPEVKHGPAGTSAKCTAGGSTQLRNPWSCTITYADGNRRAYRVTVAADE